MKDTVQAAKVGALVVAALVAAFFLYRAVDEKLERTVALKIPPGTRSGRRLRLRGQGLAQAGGGYGDCIARVELDLPATLTPLQRELLARLAAEEGKP